MARTGMGPFRRGRTVVFLGKRGVGKSSTLNYLFGFDRPTDAARESTVAPYAQWISCQAAAWYRIVDMPGIAADIESYERYRRYYRRWMRRADTVVWITQADVGAYKQDQIFFRDYSRFTRPGTRLVLALSKADTLTVRLADADAGIGAESGATADLLRRKARDASAQLLPFAWGAPGGVPVVPYSVAREWNVEALRSAVLAVLDGLRQEIR